MDLTQKNIRETKFYHLLFNLMLENESIDAFPSLLRIIARHFRFDTILYYAFDTNDSTAEIATFYSKHIIEYRKYINSIDYPFIARLKEGKAFIIREKEISEKYFRTFFAGRKTQASVIFPILWSKKSIGFISLENEAAFVYTENFKTDIRTIQKIISDFLNKQSTDRQNAESKTNLNYIIKNSNDPVFIINSKMHFVQINPAVTEYFGYELDELKSFSQDSMIFNNYFDQIRNFFENGARLSPLAMDYAVAKDGRIIPVQIRSKILQSESNKQVMLMVHDIVDRKENEQMILRTIIETEERERKRFAKDLHDGLGPLLSTIKLFINQLDDKDLKKKDKSELILQATEMIDEAIASAKDISNNLMPSVIRDFGLIAAIESFCQKINVVEHIDVFFDPNVSSAHFNKTVEIVLYRIVKELINNTIKYAKAQHINITLNEKDKRLQLLYEDDGVGFDVQAVMNSRTKGMGLNNIITRAKSVNGTCMIKSVLGQGVSVVVDINF